MHDLIRYLRTVDDLDGQSVIVWSGRIRGYCLPRMPISREVALRIITDLVRTGELFTGFDQLTGEPTFHWVQRTAPTTNRMQALN